MPPVLREISPDRIKRNPENPRLFFRDEEMDTLTASIKRYGVQVPITVYADGSEFVLIDGERRWRCARKLNLHRIPALVQEKPTRLENLLLMFNIHALREQWDYLTIARKLPDVIELFEREKGREPTEAELSELTGLTRGQIRRCRFLLDLPDRYRELLEKELGPVVK
jgi:ParB/RepB/Spo0J family partition protein